MGGGLVQVKRARSLIYPQATRAFATRFRGSRYLVLFDLYGPIPQPTKKPATQATFYSFIVTKARPAKRARGCRDEHDLVICSTLLQDLSSSQEKDRGGMK